MNTLQDYLWVLIRLLGSLGLLIFGMRTMSEALQKMAGAHLRHILSALTSNRLMGVFTGAFVTAAVQSSSATTVLVVSFVSAGLLSLAQAISVIMGANIGTTLTAWILSLGYSVDLNMIVFPALFAGVLLIYNKRLRFGGDFLFGIAFMLLSLVMLSQAGKDLNLAENQAVVDFFASFDTGSYLTILCFLVIGTLITCIVQSSAAVMAITILLCSTGVLPIHLGIALVLGENVGTTATANLAALGAGPAARRAALAHLLFNVIGVVWVMVVFYPFVDLVCRIVGYDPSVGGQAARLPVVLAMFHTCFNVTNTIFLLPFISQIERAVCKIIPESAEPAQEEDVFRLQYIESNLVQTPEISVLQAQKEVIQMGLRAQDMFALVVQLFDTEKDEDFAPLLARVEKQEDILDQIEIAIARYLEQVSENHLSDETKQKVRMMLRQISEIESVGDACYNLARAQNRHRRTGHRFTAEQLTQIHDMLRLTTEAIEQMNVVLGGRLENLSINETYRIENEINQLRSNLKDQNIKAVDEHRYDYATGTAFVDAVNECERLGDYVVNVVQARFGK